MTRLIDADLLDRAMYQKSFEVDDGRNVWNSGLWIRYKIYEEASREAPTVMAIPVQFITDKINSLEYLQKKMSAWTTPELEIQINTLMQLIRDYAQIASGNYKEEE